MCGQRTVWIKAHVARCEQQPRIADVMHGLHLLRANFLFDPQELTLAREILDQTLFIEVWKDFDQLFGRHFGVDQMARLRVERVGLKVRRQQVAVAVCDVGARGRDHGPRRVAARPKDPCARR